MQTYHSEILGRTVTIPGNAILDLREWVAACGAAGATRFNGGTSTDGLKSFDDITARNGRQVVGFWDGTDQTGEVY